MPALSSSSRLALGLLAVAACAPLAIAQGNPPVPGAITPSAPSIPLTAAALANGVQDRITTSYGIEFVTVGAAGNAPLATTGRANGRGSVGYEYRIARSETTTAQWVDFMNAVSMRPASEAIPFISPPQGIWGGRIDSTYTGPGVRYEVIPGRENQGVGNISWRTSAIYCNWLHNDQAITRDAFLGGAYDVSTFGYVFNPATGQNDIATDQIARSAGARFFLPTWDEWLKAVHYDPSANGGAGAWWQQPNASNTPLTYGPPTNSQAQSSAGFSSPNPFTIPLGSYPTVQTPWGLLDASGGAAEWTESPDRANTGEVYRFIDGSAWTQNGVLDRPSAYGSWFPSLDLGYFGFRVAASIPSPSVALTVVVGGALFFRRGRRP
jgi:formylglycine-generating enzyme required for sulfatase activity